MRGMFLESEIRQIFIDAHGIETQYECGPNGEEGVRFELPGTGDEYSWDEFDETLRASGVLVNGTHDGSYDPHKHLAALAAHTEE